MNDPNACLPLEYFHPLKKQTNWNAVLRLTSLVCIGYCLGKEKEWQVEWMEGDVLSILGVSGQQDFEKHGGLAGLLDPASRSELFAMQQQLFIQGEGSGELCIFTPVGETRWLKALLRSDTAFKEGTPFHFQVFLQNITENKQIESHHNLLKAMMETTSTLIRSYNLLETLEPILYNVLNLLSADLVELLIIEQENQIGRKLFVSRQSPALSDSPAENPAEITYLKPLLSNGVPFCIFDIQKAEPSLKMPEAWVASFMAAPVQGEKQAIAYLSVFSSRPGHYQEDHLEQLQVFASQTALAIQNSYLFAEFQRSTAESATLRESIAAVASKQSRAAVLSRILDQLGQVVPFHTASAGYLIGDGLEIVAVSGFPNPEEILGLKFPIQSNNPSSEVYETNRTVIVADTHAAFERYPHFKFPPHDRIRSWMGVPLVYRGKFIGILAIDSEKPNHFTEAFARITSVYADQVAVALETANLVDHVRQRAIESETLQQATAAIASTFNLSEIVDSILEQLKRVICYQTATFLLRDQNDMVVHGTRGLYPQEQLSGLRFPIHANTIDAEVVRTGRPLIIPNIHKQTICYLNPEYSKTITSLLVVPLIFDDEVIGEIGVDSPDENCYNDEHVRLLTAFANQVVVAIKNSRLYNSLQEELKTRKEMEEELRRLAITDALTGCFNRRHFMNLAQNEYLRSIRYHHSLSIIMLDIDHFKIVNDTYGHPAGDDVLVQVVQLCQKNIRHNDLLARYGGEEFIMLLPETCAMDAQALAERMRKEFQNHPIYREGDISIHTTVSMGIATLSPQRSIPLEKLLKYADEALYRSKENGRNRVTFSEFC